MTGLKFFLFSSAVLITCFTQAQKLAPDAFEQQLKQTPAGQLVDVRTSGEFGGGHLVGAKNFDFRNPAFAQSLTQLDKSKPVFLYCLSGGRSTEAAAIMREQGFQNVYELQGGYLKWTTKMKPVEGVPVGKPGVGISQEEMNAILVKNDLVLIDFFASWCAPCMKMMPIVEKLEQTYAGRLAVVKVNSDANKALLAQFQVDEIPTLLLMKKNQPKQRLIGLQTESTLTELVEEQLK